MRVYLFCPFCKTDLEDTPEGLRKCPSCKFTHYDNPIPVVACLVPVDQGIVLVRRGVPPFEGEWCLPCGYINKYEHPKAACVRETKEETGLVVRLEQNLSVCNPSLEDYPLNQMVIHYLGRVVGGNLRAGDDALSVGVYGKEELPAICFRSHGMVIDEWFDGKYGEITGIDL